MLSKEVSSIIFKVFGMTRPGIERRSPGPLANTLPTSHYANKKFANIVLDTEIVEQVNNQRKISTYEHEKSVTSRFTCYAQSSDKTSEKVTNQL